MALTSNGVDLASMLSRQLESIAFEDALLNSVESNHIQSSSSEVTAASDNAADGNGSGSNNRNASVSPSEDGSEFRIPTANDLSSDITLFNIGVGDENMLNLAALVNIVRDVATPHFQKFFTAVFGEQLEELLKPVNTSPPQQAPDQPEESPLNDLRAYIHLFHRHWQLLRRYFLHQPSVQSWAHEVRALLRTAAHRLKSDLTSVTSQVEAVCKLLEALEKSPLPMALPTNSTTQSRNMIRESLQQLRLEEYEVNGSPSNSSRRGSASPSSQHSMSGDQKDRIQGQTYAKLRHQMGTCSVCRHYLRGFCDRGDQCGFCHDSTHVPLHSRNSNSGPSHEGLSNNTSGENRRDRNSQYGGLKGQPLAKERHLQKTCSVCRHYLRGFCDRGEDCNFCHDTSHFKDLPPSVMEELLRTKNRGKATGQALARIRHEQKLCSVCRHYGRGYCDLGDDCTFCHDRSHLSTSFNNAGLMKSAHPPSPIGIPTPIGRPVGANVHPSSRPHGMSSPTLFSPYGTHPPAFPMVCQFCSRRPGEIFLEPCKHVCCPECLSRWRPDACPCGMVYEHYYSIPPVV